MRDQEIRRSVDQYKFKCEKAYSALDFQTREVDELRNRAGLVASAIGIASSFLAIRDLSIHVPLSLNLVTISMLGSGLGFLMPTMKSIPKWKLALSAQVLLDGWIDAYPDMTDPDFYSDLAHQLESDFDQNAVIIAMIRRRFNIGLWVSMASLAT